MEKRKTGWFHPAHGEKKNGLVSSSPWRKEKQAGYIQPMELKAIEKRNMDWFREKKKGEQKNLPGNVFTSVSRWCNCVV